MQKLTTIIIHVSAMPQEEHAGPDHGNYLAEAAVQVDGLDTICGTFREGACAPEEYLELLDRLDMNVALLIEAVVLMLEVVLPAGMLVLDR